MGKKTVTCNKRKLIFYEKHIRKLCLNLKQFLTRKIDIEQFLMHKRTVLTPKIDLKVFNKTNFNSSF